MNVRNLRFRDSAAASEQTFGRIEVGRNANKDTVSSTENAYTDHLAYLESIRLTGYKFLKPPGVTKTLKNLHEEEAYNQEYSSTGLNQAESPELETESSSEQAPTNVFENQRLTDDEDNFSFAPDLSLPTMDASLPSMYHH